MFDLQAISLLWLLIFIVVVLKAFQNVMPGIIFQVMGLFPFNFCCQFLLLQPLGLDKNDGINKKRHRSELKGVPISN